MGEGSIEETTRDIGEVQIGVKGHEFRRGIALLYDVSTHTEVFVSNII